MRNLKRLKKELLKEKNLEAFDDVYFICCILESTKIKISRVTNSAMISFMNT